MILYDLPPGTMLFRAHTPKWGDLKKGAITYAKDPPTATRHPITWL
jgi:hypothetical protein